MVADTKKNVETGAQITRECGEVFESVVQNVNSVSGMATEIASASQEQSRGCGEITKAMNQLDQMTQQNASTSEECASAAEELSAQADTLKAAVTRLILTVSGTSSQAAASASEPVASRDVQRTAAKPPRAQPAAGKVLHMRSTVRGAAPATMPPAEPHAVKLVVGGDAPAYDSEGFKDV
jgi:methyl-accepting chemotaxis protein